MYTHSVLCCAFAMEVRQLTLDEILERYVAVCDHGRECTECCHLWVGKTSYHYGYLVYKGKRCNAHRFIYILTHNIELQRSDYICHVPWCLSSLCCNVHHLYSGTAQSNARDYYLQCIFGRQSVWTEDMISISIIARTMPKWENICKIIALKVNKK
jgi:hypothetical protein